MAEISCKHCGSPDCRGCNIYRLEQMLDAGKLDPLMNENRLIQISADVAPVVRGRWREMDKGNYVCSSCNAFITINYGYKYCPNCGAKMDGGQDDA